MKLLTSFFWQVQQVSYELPFYTLFLITVSEKYAQGNFFEIFLVRKKLLWWCYVKQYYKQFLLLSYQIITSAGKLHTSLNLISLILTALFLTRYFHIDIIKDFEMATLLRQLRTNWNQKQRNEGVSSGKCSCTHQSVISNDWNKDGD